MPYQLSDNGLAAVKEVCKVLGALIAVLGLWVQQHNQHVDRMRALEANTAQLKAIEAKLQPRPLVYGEKPK